MNNLSGFGFLIALGMVLATLVLMQQCHYQHIDEMACTQKGGRYFNYRCNFEEKK